MRISELKSARAARRLTCSVAQAIGEVQRASRRLSAGAARSWSVRAVPAGQGRRLVVRGVCGQGRRVARRKAVGRIVLRLVPPGRCPGGRRGGPGVRRRRGRRRRWRRWTGSGARRARRRCRAPLHEGKALAEKGGDLFLLAGQGPDLYVQCAVDVGHEGAPFRCWAARKRPGNAVIGWRGPGLPYSRVDMSLSQLLTWFLGVGVWICGSARWRHRAHLQLTAEACPASTGSEGDR